MRRILLMSLFIGAVVCAPITTWGANLLTNGDLNSLTQIGSPAFYYPTPTGWTLNTDPCSSTPCTIVRYPGFPAEYAEHSNPGMAGKNGVVFNSTEGDFPGYPDVILVDADLFQSVPAVAGETYRMTGWAYFEGGYAGGVDTIASNTGATRAGLPSLTDTFFALEFLDAANAVLPGSVVVELRADGQVNNPDITEATRNWLQHTLVGTAPAGTVNVRVRASMVDGEFNIDMPHQAAWVDDFSLEIVPEPTTLLLSVLSVAMASLAHRRR